MNSDNFKATVDWYSTHANKYDDWVGAYYSPEQVTSFISLLPTGAKVLDAGCGTGRDTNFMKDAGVEAIGLDVAPGMVQVAQQKYPHVEFVQGDFRALTFENESFDGIWSHAALVNLETNEEVQQSLKEFNRVLRLGGILHVLVKKKQGEYSIYLSEDHENQGRRIVHYFSEDEIKELLLTMGFEPFIVEVYGENERNPQGRSNVTWIHTLSRKVGQPRLESPEQ